MRRVRRKVSQVDANGNRTLVAGRSRFDKDRNSCTDDFCFLLSVLALYTRDIEGILAKIDTLLAAAGTDKSKLISAQIWVKDISQHFKPMNKVWCAWLDPKSKPVRATVEANLALPDLLVEIQVTAAV